MTGASKLSWYFTDQTATSFPRLCVRGHVLIYLHKVWQTGRNPPAPWEWPGVWFVKGKMPGKVSVIQANTRVLRKAAVLSRFSLVSKGFFPLHSRPGGQSWMCTLQCLHPILCSLRICRAHQPVLCYPQFSSQKVGCMSHVSYDNCLSKCTVTVYIITSTSARDSGTQMVHSSIAPLITEGHDRCWIGSDEPTPTWGVTEQRNNPWHFADDRSMLNLTRTFWNWMHGHMTLANWTTFIIIPKVSLIRHSNVKM
jgi:hypothetical protein